jgi:hypothetical protein
MPAFERATALARSFPRTRKPSLCLDHSLWVGQRLDSRVRGNERFFAATLHHDDIDKP